MSTHDREILRRLASRWMEPANQPVRAERKRLCTALKDLRAERPMVLFETGTPENYVAEAELECADPFFRGVERQMRWTIRHAEEVGDDIVIDPCWRMGWHVDASGYGVDDIPFKRAEDVEGGHVAYAFDHPIRTPQHVNRLQPRTGRVDREKTRQQLERLADAFGDVLPVVLHGTRGMFAGLTQDLFKLIGNDNLMMGTYDEPQTLHRLMSYLRDDRFRRVPSKPHVAMGVSPLKSSSQGRGREVGGCKRLPPGDYIPRRVSHRRRPFAAAAVGGDGARPHRRLNDGRLE